MGTGAGRRQGPRLLCAGLATGALAFAAPAAASMGTDPPPAVAAWQVLVTIPAEYVYQPSRGPLHDYCTASPDRYLAADFRGPCARHDLCYQRPGNHQKTCDDQLLRDLRQNCDHAYPRPTTIRATCRAMAHTYWLMVIAFGRDHRTRLVARHA